MSGITNADNLQHESLWFYINKLTALRWAITLNGFKRLKPGRKALYLGLMVLVALVVVGIFVLTTYLLGVMNSAIATQNGTQMQAFLDAIPGLFLTIAFLMIMVCSFAVLLQALYLANDMDFLLSTPVPIRAVFLSKLLQAILPNLVLVGVICLPILFGLGVTESYRLLYYPMVIVLLVVLALAAAGIASLLVMAAVRILPAKRVAEVLGFVSAILFMVLSQWMNLTGVTDESITPGQVARSAGAITKLNIGWSPMAWGGQGLVELGHGSTLLGSLYILLILGVCAGAFWLSLVSAEHLYYSGWASMQVSAQHKKTRRKSNHPAFGASFPGILRNWVPVQVAALVGKDLMEIRRDLRLMAKLIMPMIMGIVFAVMVLRGGNKPATVAGGIQPWTDAITSSIPTYASLLIPVFVGWMLVLNLATFSFSMEGRNYWILKSAPLSSRKLLAAKFLTTYLPALLITWLYMVGTAIVQRAPFAILCYGLVCAVLILAGMVGINLAFGVRFANMSWTDPRQMTYGAGSYLAMFAGIAYLIMCYVVFIAPPVALPMLGASQALGQAAGLLIGGAIVLACTILPLMRVEGHVALLGEE